MPNREDIIAKAAAIAERVAASEGLEIVEIEMLGGGKDRTLRIFIDRPPAPGQTVPVGQPWGVSLGDCETVSQRMSEILDAEDVVPGGQYKLEVSSPGVERKLLRPVDYQRFVGHKAKLRLREPVENQKVLEGVLQDFRDNVVILEQAKGRTSQIPISQIERANLKFTW